jgi:hypothetical protein
MERKAKIVVGHEGLSARPWALIVVSSGARFRRRRISHATPKDR